MSTRHVDVAILGAGTAGLNARHEVERLGKTCVMVDPGPYGTTCARVGCMPSKLLIAAADAAHAARDAQRFGVHAGAIRVDGPAVMRRVQAERDRFAGFVADRLEARPPEDLIRARGHLIDAHTIETTDGQRVEAGAVVIATGSHPWMPPGLETIAPHLLTTDTVFELPDLPRRLLVLGAGVVGLELGQALDRLGVQVTILSTGADVLGIRDPRVGAVARDVLQDELDLHLGATLLATEAHGDEVFARWREADGAEQEGRFDRVLVAAGRRPNLQDLGLDRLGLPLRSDGTPPIDPFTLQIGLLPLFVAGDASADRPLLHEASDEGRIAGANAASFPEVSHGARRTPLAIAFTEPQLAVVGAPYSEDWAVGEVSFDDQGRSRIIGRNQGFGRLYADRATCRLVGATLVGPRAEHLGHLLAWAVAEGLTVVEALGRPFYHPVIEEGLRTALRDLAASLAIAGRCPPEDRADAPGA